MKSKRWTEEEEEYFEYYLLNPEDTPYEEIAAFLNKSVNALYAKAHRMRKKNNNLPSQRRRYTEKEKEYIKKCYEQQIPLSTISKHLRRNPISVNYKAKKMGLINVIYAKEHDKEIRDMAKRGLWKSEIARQIGVRRNVIVRYTLDNNIHCEPAPAETNEKFIEMGRDFNSLVFINRRTYHERFKRDK